jgi:RNA polymerase-binding transcription factor DksA
MPASAVQPAPTHLTPRLISELAQALVAELEFQELQVRNLEAVVELLTGHADGDSLLEREIAGRSLQRAAEVVAAVRRALVRIADGTYGTCERCGTMIAVERLEVLPFTRHCVGCPPPAALAG